MFRQLLDRVSGRSTRQAPPRLHAPWASRLPSRCAVCHAWPAEPVCEPCVQRFAQPAVRCHTCALPLPGLALRAGGGPTHCGACLQHPPPLDRCLAALDYAYPWSDSVARFKFHDEPGWAAFFATLLRSTPWVEPALEQADWVLPMPLSRQRLSQRGYNQTLLLARHLVPGSAPARTDAGLLLRVRDTPPQHSLPRAERLRNVTGAFAVEPLRAIELRGKRVVLVDDVMTTGASLFAAAQTLREAGAAHITAVVLARTPAD